MGEARESLRNYLGWLVLVQGTIYRNGYPKFKNATQSRDITNTKIIFGATIQAFEYLSRSIQFTNERTTCLVDISINGTEIGVDHIWVTNYLSPCNNTNRVKFIGKVYSYERKEGDWAYGIEYCGIPVNLGGGIAFT